MRSRLNEPMPEGDTIHYAARRIRPLVEGRVPEIAHPNPRLRGERWPEKLAGRAVTRVDAHGKHLFVHFEGDLAIHSHLRMTGSWGTYRDGQRWRRAQRRAWLVLRTDAGEVVQFDGPVLELLTESRTRFDRRLAMLGPDILAPELDEPGFLRHPRDRRRAARPAHDRRHRQPLEVRGLLRCAGRPVAADRRGHRRRGAGDRARGAPGHAAVRARRDAGSAPRRLRPGRPAVPALRRADPQPWPGRRQPADVLVRGLPVVSGADNGRASGAMRRVGHKGADHIAPGNTFDSFADAVYDGIELIVDMKTAGYEARVAAALREHRLSDRVLVSTMENASLKVLRERHPELRLGWSLPRMRRNPLANPVTMLPAVAVLTYVRRALPGVVANRIRRGEIDALMAHYRLVTPRLADAIRAAGGELYAWTVDDAARIAELERCGVTGVISNDPRLFGP
jgi:glycerophosphoryl diester phosphodiesterase